MPLSPLDDSNTYLKIAQAAASRGNPMQAPPAQEQQPEIPPEAILQALSAVQPPLAPEQLQSIVRIFTQLMSAEDASEPPETPEMPPGQVAPGAGPRGDF